MQVKLKVLSGKNAGQVLPIARDEFFIGRDPTCHLRPQSDSIAGRHCRLARRNDELTVLDFGSATGTFVNGQKIDKEQILATGDRLKVGPLEFEVLVEYELGGKKREKVKDIADVAARTASQGPDRDEDIDDWLSDKDVVRQPQKKVFGLDDIKVVSAKKDEEERKAAEKQADKKKGTDKEAKKLPGKLPEQPSVSGKDTREAANEVLRKLWKKS